MLIGPPARLGWQPPREGEIDDDICAREQARGGDVGANYGYVTCHAARLVGPTGLVLSIEPNPATMAVLRGQLVRNGHSTVRTIECAISDRTGEATFVIATSDDLSRLENKKANTHGLVPASQIRVRMAPLDDVIAENLPEGTQVSIVKVDVEGRELDVLAGAAKLLGRQEAIFILEVNPGALAHNDVSFEDIFQFLAKFNYRIYAIDNGSGKPVTLRRYARLREITDPRTGGRFSDVVAVPNRRDLHIS